MKRLSGIILILFTMFFVFPGTGLPKENTKKLAMKVENVALGDILESVRVEHGVEIIGMESRTNEKVTFSCNDLVPEAALKKLLRHLGETNFAFEFNNGKLKKISVFPTSSAKTTRPSPPVRPEKRVFGSVVEIQGIVKDSQAEEIGLKRGDIVVDYDGTKINDTAALISEVKRKSDMSHVEMTILRDNETMHFTLSGGLIGIRINTKRVPSEEN